MATVYAIQDSDGTVIFMGTVFEAKGVRRSVAQEIARAPIQGADDATSSSIPAAVSNAVSAEVAAQKGVDSVGRDERV